MATALLSCGLLIGGLFGSGIGCAETFSVARGSAVGMLSMAQAGGSDTQAPDKDAGSDWAYTLRPGDNIKALSKTLLDGKHNWMALLKYNDMSTDQALHAGQVLKIPLNWLRHHPLPATTLAVTGSVYYRRPGGSFSALGSGTKLNVGDEVRAEQGHAVIELADQSIVRLGAHSQLMFDRLTHYGQTGMADTRMRLSKGSLSTKVHPLSDPHSRFEIETPSAVAAVRGTEFRLHTDDSATRLEVTRGKVAFSNSYRQTLVPAGFGASLGDAGSFAQHQLPPKPRPPSSPGSITLLPTSLAWHPVPRANAYQLDLFNTRTGAWIRSQKLRLPKVDLDDLDNGPYRAELSAIDGDGMEGPASPVSFKIALKAQMAHLKQPAEGTRVKKGPVTFSWQFQGSNQQARVQVSSTRDFAKLAAQSPWLTANKSSMSRALSPGLYFWRVQTRAGGSSKALSKVNRFVVPGKLPEVRIITANYVKNQVRIFWRQVPGIQGYRLQLSADANFTKIIREETINTNTVALRLIPGRHYFVRIKAVSSGPLKSVWGPARELYVQ